MREMQNRLIKFRAFHKIEKRMFQVNMIDFVYETVYEFIYDQDELCGSKAYRFSEVEIMQFISLKDCNGKVFYEGDVVKWGHLDIWPKTYPHTIAVIETNPDIQFVDNYGQIFYYGNFSDANMSEKALEILGNIYENPELLEAV